MPIEDSDFHARRNVILVSASILLAAWLRQDLPIILSAFGLAQVPSATAERVWVALFVLVVYLLARYHFSPDKSLKWKEGAEVLGGLQHRWLTPWLKRMLASETEKKRREKGSDFIKMSPDFYTIPWLELGRGRTVYYQYGYDDDDPREIESRYQWENNDTAKLPWFFWICNVAVSFTVRMLMSRAGLEVAFPYGLAIAALCIAASKTGWIA